MRVHYVEDNDQDAELYSRMIREEGKVDIVVSSRLEDFEKSGSRGETDFIMLDVHRPDAVSIEDDINRIRAFTDVPIVLVTSDVSEAVRQQAFAGGADAVLDKLDLNANVLRQIALNSTLKHKIIADKADKPGAEDTEPKIENEEMKVSLAAFRDTFSYIETSLSTLYESMADSGRSQTANYISHLSETVQAIQVYAQDDLRQSTRAPIHELMLKAAKRVSLDARARGIDLIIETENSWFTQMGSEPLASLGINHLLGGLIRSCGKGDRISVRSERDEAGIALNLFLSRIVVDSAEALFNLDLANPSMGFDAKASIQLGLTLLSVPKEQVDVHTHRSNLFIKIRI